jgi:hypothetical protein
MSAHPIVTIATISTLISKDDSNDPFINKFGGKPLFLQSPSAAQQTIIDKTLKCEFCKGLVMTLVAQLYAPLDSLPTHHRFLNIFCCPNCSNSSLGYLLMI